MCAHGQIYSARVMARLFINPHGRYRGIITNLGLEFRFDNDAKCYG